MKSYRIIDASYCPTLNCKGGIAYEVCSHWSDSSYIFVKIKMPDGSWCKNGHYGDGRLAGEERDAGYNISSWVLKNKEYFEEIVETKPSTFSIGDRVVVTKVINTSANGYTPFGFVVYVGCKGTIVSGNYWDKGLRIQLDIYGTQSNIDPIQLEKLVSTTVIGSMTAHEIQEAKKLVDSMDESLDDLIKSAEAVEPKAEFLYFTDKYKPVEKKEEEEDRCDWCDNTLEDCVCSEEEEESYEDNEYDEQEEEMEGRNIDDLLADAEEAEAEVRKSQKATTPKKVVTVTAKVIKKADGYEVKESRETKFNDAAEMDVFTPRKPARAKFKAKSIL